MIARACAVIPTYERRDLALECIGSLERQTIPVDIVVVDGASGDGTVAAIRSQHPAVHVVELPRNAGSAGGFGAGIAWAYEAGYEWIWLTDNDSEAQPDALEQLLAAHASFADENPPLLLASKVVWTDGSILALNAPILKRKELEPLYRAAEYRTLSVRAAPYAGVLIHRDLVLRHGLPIEDYFVWNDDIEYTGRLLRHDFGVLVPRSVVCHKPEVLAPTTAWAGKRFYFEVRNKLWLVLYSNAFSPSERLRFVGMLGVNCLRHLRISGLTGAVTIGRGVAGALRRRPRGAPSVREGDGAALDI